MLLLLKQEKPKSEDDVMIDCLNCGKMVLLKDWYAHNSNCEGGSSGEATNNSSQVHKADDQEDDGATADHYDVGCDFSITTRKDGAKPQDPMSTLFHKGENAISWYNLLCN